MCVLGMGKLRLPPSPSLRDCPSIPPLANGNLVPQEQDLMRTSPLRNLLPRQPPQDALGWKAVIRIILGLFRCGCCPGGHQAQGLP